jgi:hypothetical protein
MVAFFALVALVMFTLFVGVLLTWGSVAVVVAAIVLWWRARQRPAFFLSTERLLHRGLFGGWQSVPLASIARCRRRVVRRYDRFGNVEDVQTDTAILTFANGFERYYGPVRDIEDLLDLVQQGAITRSVNLAALEGLDGTPPAAAARPDFFVALRTRSGPEAYGPLLVGPTRAIRFTDKLPVILEAILLTLLAGSTPAEQIEPQLDALLRHPKAGHALVVSLSDVALDMRGADFVLKGSQREEIVTLEPDDAARAAAFVAARRRDHPMR